MPAIHLKPGEAFVVGGIRVKPGSVDDRGVTLHVGCGDAPVMIETEDGKQRPLSAKRESLAKSNLSH